MYYYKINTINETIVKNSLAMHLHLLSLKGTLESNQIIVRATPTKGSKSIKGEMFLVTENKGYIYTLFNRNDKMFIAEINEEGFKINLVDSK